MFSVPNGARVDIRKAKRLVKEGLTAGVPDIFIPEPSRGFHGLFIEFKSKMGRVSDKQKLLQGILIMRGYKVEVCWSFEDFQRVVKAYY